MKEPKFIFNIKLPNFILTFIFLYLCLANIKITNAQKIAVGKAHALIVCKDSTVLSLGGYNVFGQMGNGTMINSGCMCQMTPVQVSGLNRVIEVAGGGYHNLALKADGTIWAWGANFAGQLGNGTITSTQCACEPIPVPVSGINNVISISAGYSHSMALRADGTVWTWGRNHVGQLGIGTLSDQTQPMQVLGLSDVVSIDCSQNDASFAVKSDGTVWAWGANVHGQLGDSSTVGFRPLPVKVYGLTNIVSVKGGWYHTIALSRDGTVWTWGDNIYGTIGNGTTSQNPFQYIIPIQLLSLSSIIAIDAGGGFCFALKNDGQIYSWGLGTALGRIPDLSNYFTLIPELITSLSGIVEMNGGGQMGIALRSDGSVYVWGVNSFGDLGIGDTLNHYLPTHLTGICSVNTPYKFYKYHVNGIIYNDSTSDCLIQSYENRLPIIALSSSNGNYYTFSDDSGRYTIGTNDTLNFDIRPIVPSYLSSLITNGCPSQRTVSFNSTTSADTSGFDFGFNVIPCHLLGVDVFGNRKRRCFLNTTYVFYWNQGTANADSVKIQVKFDQYDIPLSASIPYIYNTTNNTLSFFIGTLTPGQSGMIIIQDSIACIQGLEGLTQCTEVKISASNDCETDSTINPDWDNSTIHVDGECKNDTVVFAINNLGSDMSSQSAFRIYSNNILIQNGNFQLLSGDSRQFKLISRGKTIRLEADQSVGHPGNSYPRKTIEACGTDENGVFATGFVNQVVQDDFDTNVEIDCMEITGSYDPNLKTSNPTGVGNNHIILPKTPIGYTIQFQNTGNDTAFKVIVIDSLNTNFDLSTLEFGASSHPYKVELSGEGIAVLKFTFDNILLPDSFTNEPESHGFLNFKISPNSQLPLGTIIENIADIYFDFNESIRTNTNSLTLGQYVIDSTSNVNPGFINNIICFPNPATDYITVEIVDGDQLEKIILYSIEGKVIKVFKFKVFLEKVKIDLSNVTAGMYYLNCTSKNQNNLIKIIKQ